jgi:hypothetical protein
MVLFEQSGLSSTDKYVHHDTTDTMLKVALNNNIPKLASGAGTAYSSGIPKFIPGF